jgi:hypothetical protein
VLSDGIAPTHRSWATEQNSTRGILFLLVLWGRNSTRGILSYSRDGRRPRRLIGESKNLIAKGRLNRPFAVSGDRNSKPEDLCHRRNKKAP